MVKPLSDTFLSLISDSGVEPYAARIADFTQVKKDPCEEKTEIARSGVAAGQDSFVREDDPTVLDRRKYQSLIG